MGSRLQRGSAGLAVLAVVVLLGASSAAAKPVLHWWGRSQPQFGVVVPVASIASAASSRDIPESAAVRAFKARMAKSHGLRLARMERTRGRGPRGAHLASGPSVWAGLGSPGTDALTGGGFSPADVSVGEGAGWVAEAVNTGLSVWTRTGALVERVPLGRLLNAPNDDLGDPQIVYDDLSGRWFLSAMRANAGSTYVAVSNSSSPTSGWSSYYFSYGSSFCPDQPRLGVSSYVVAVSVAVFADPACHSSEPPEVGGAVVAIDKAAMIAGAFSPGSQDFGPDPAYDNYQPARELAPSAEELFVSAQIPTSNVIHVIHFAGVPPNATVTATDTFLVTSLSTPPNAAQRGSNVLIDTGDNRISSAVLLNGVLYIEANDACTDSTGTTHSCVRVMEVDTTANQLIGEEDLGTDGGDWYYGAVSPDSSGNLIAVFDYSSPSDYPSIGSIAAMRPIQGENDATLTYWITLANGTAPSESGRYGDYSGAALDLDNPADVWVGSEVGDSLGVDTYQWATHVDAISASESALPATSAHQVWYPGGVYHGRTRQGWKIGVHTGGGGGRVEEIDLGGISLRCRGKYRDVLSATLAPTPGAALAAGRFRINTSLGPDSFARWDRVTVSGVLNYSRISGTISAREGSRHHGLCQSGTVRFTAT